MDEPDAESTENNCGSGRERRTSVWVRCGEKEEREGGERKWKRTDTANPAPSSALTLESLFIPYDARTAVAGCSRTARKG
jgi:hypothetical protein